MVILRNIIAVLAISVCLAAACQKEEEVVVEEVVIESALFGGGEFGECGPHEILWDSTHFVPDGAEQHINRIAESRTVDLYIEPEGEENSYVSYDVIVEGIPDTIRCSGGWAGTFKSYKEGGLDITIYCKQHIPTRVSLEWDMEEVDFAYSEDAAYESLNVSYHW